MQASLSSIDKHMIPSVNWPLHVSISFWQYSMWHSRRRRRKDRDFAAKGIICHVIVVFNLWFRLIYAAGKKLR